MSLNIGFERSEFLSKSVGKNHLIFFIVPMRHIQCFVFCSFIPSLMTGKYNTRYIRKGRKAEDQASCVSIVRSSPMRLEQILHCASSTRKVVTLHPPAAWSRCAARRELSSIHLQKLTLCSACGRRMDSSVIVKRRYSNTIFRSADWGVLMNQNEEYYV
jgi:hypothetical protein